MKENALKELEVISHLAKVINEVMTPSWKERRLDFSL